jgi:signal transduction histidine kinase
VPLFMLMYCHRYMRLQRQGLERFMLGYTVVCTVLIGAYLKAWISKDVMAAIWLPFNLATNLYMLHILWRLQRNARSLAPFVLALALAFFVVSDVHDRLIVTATFERWVSFDATYWRPLSAVLLAFSFCLLIADQFVLAVQDVQQSAAQRQQALASERARIMREMHDGLGAQLMTALRGVERGGMDKLQMAQALQEGLDELRLLMDSSDNDQPLQAALANWRNRWDARLATVGLALRWEMDDGLDHVALPGDTVLQIMRVLQEATANVIKHAQASEVLVRAVVQADPHHPGERALLLQVIDNGVGLSGDASGAAVNRASGAGRGLGNMRQRAMLIGASVATESRSDASGAQVTLRLPLPV